MSKHHDENKDLKSFSKIGKINYGEKTLQASKTAIIGIHMWGKIDFLTKYCGWHFIWNNTAGIGGYLSSEEKDNVREAKKVKKEHKLSDKTKRSSKKK